MVARLRAAARLTIAESDRGLVTFGDSSRVAATAGSALALSAANSEGGGVLCPDRATGEVYCMPHHLTIDGTKRTLMIAALRYVDTCIKQDGVWLYAERLLSVDWIEQRALS